MRIRIRIEEIFGWRKTTGDVRRTRFVGIARTQQRSHFVGAARILLRIARLAIVATVERPTWDWR